MGHAQIAQGIEIVPFDEEIGPRPCPAGEFRIGVEGDKILIERAVKLNIVSFPDQPEFRLAVTVLNDLDQFILVVTVVFRGQRWLSSEDF